MYLEFDFQADFAMLPEYIYRTSPEIARLPWEVVIQTTLSASTVSFIFKFYKSESPSGPKGLKRFRK